MLITDREFSAVDREGAGAAAARSRSSSTSTIALAPPGKLLGEIDYERFLAEGDPDFAWQDPRRRMGRDRAQLHLGHHRQSQGRRLSPSRRLSERARQRARLEHAAPSGLSLDAADVPLQRLVLSLDGDGARRHACLPAPRRGRRDLSPRSPSEGVTHLCGAPIVMNMLLNAPEDERRKRAGAASHDDRRRRAARRRDRGHGSGWASDITHVYGLTESLWARHGLRLARRMGRAPRRRAARARKARQGVRYPVLEGLMVADPADARAGAARRRRRWARSSCAATS